MPRNHCAAYPGFSVWLRPDSAYLPIRYLQDPIFNYAGHYLPNGNFERLNLSSFEGFFWLITGKGFQSLMFRVPFSNFGHEFINLIFHIVRSQFFIGFGPGLFGLILSIKKKDPFGLTLVLICLLNICFYISYFVFDKDTMWLFVDFIWIIFYSIGTTTLLITMRKQLNYLSGNRITTITNLLLILFSIASFFWNFPFVNQNKNNSTEVMVEEIFEILPPDSYIIGYWDTIPAIQYYQFVENKRPDITALNRFLIGEKNYPLLLLNLGKTKKLYMSMAPTNIPQGLNYSKIENLYLISD